MTPQISVTLEPSDWPDPKWRNYHLAGNVIRGEVRVESDGPLECRAVRCVVGWHTEGRGDRDEGVAAAMTLHDGPLNGNRSFPFEASIPVNGPISYQGHYINIVWSAKAVIDLAWKKDPVSEAQFVVLPAPYTAEAV